MMVTFVSQCNKKALSRTRRVLDAFANRIGNNTWQTVVTEDGLLAIKKLLRKTASKNTAVSCHWIRSRSRSELAWIVGDRSRFNYVGTVPVNTTQRNLLIDDTQNDWDYLPLIKSLVALSALFHDWGKATTLFQDKLNPKKGKRLKGDPIRHEWISLLLLNTFIQSTDVSSDHDWLNQLSNGNIDETLLKNNISNENLKPLSNLPPIAKLVAWLIVSHHRLPLPDIKKWSDYTSESADSIDVMLSRITKEWGYENRFDEKDYQERLRDCFNFPHGLISNSNAWISQVKKWSKRLIELQSQAKQCINDGSYRLILNQARLALMLGDHYYSSQAADKKWQDDVGLFANTDRKTNQLKQKLDEHLVGVAKYGLQTAHLLPAFESEPPVAQDIHRLDEKSHPKFAWQDHAVNKIKDWQQTVESKTKLKYGFFAINMASTGCGKTFANAKVMRTLSEDKKSLRFVLALGLRTLTLQTGDEYRERVGLDDSELAVLIGSRAVMELHQENKTEEEKSFENSGSLSEESLLDEEIDYECAIPEKGLSTVLTCDRDKKFLYAPVLACTIDHLMAATETKRGGRYILPTLRLMSSDLVIDEIDDFSEADLIAIGRLVHLAGMLGRKVMLSSATITPHIAEGFFNVYRHGWNLFCKTRKTSEIIGCAWIDEFSTKVTGNHFMNTPENNLDFKSIGQYRADDKDFIEYRDKELEKQPAKRKANIVKCDSIINDYRNENHNDQTVIKNKRLAYFELMAESALIKHQYFHFKDEKTALNVSFGVIRTANIKPCVQLTQYLLEKDWPSFTEVRVMAYHSQQTLLLRSEQEKHLDKVLNRKEKDGEIPKAFNDAIIRQHLDEINSNSPTTKEVLFILVATPVEEVGRDHDFDWAVIEPSSYRSIIQLAGRVRRHRDGEVDFPNIAIMQYNLKGILHHHNPSKTVFTQPGFENYIPLKNHALDLIVDEVSIAERLDARPRIKLPENVDANYLRTLVTAKSLIELEHAAIWQAVANYKSTQTSPSTMHGWLYHHWFLSGLSQSLTPFRKSSPTLKVFLAFNEEEDSNRFCEKNVEGHYVVREKALNINRYEISEKANKRLWLHRDFKESCLTLANKKDISLRWASLRYGELSFRHNEGKHYYYDDQLGMFEED